MAARPPSPSLAPLLVVVLALGLALLVAVLLLRPAPGASAAATTCPALRSVHLPLGPPCGTEAEDLLLVREAYALANDRLRKGPTWVAYRVDRRTGSGHDVERDWHADPWLPDDARLEPEDFRGAADALGVDRGHMAPLASLDGLPDVDDLNLLSNISPQRRELNRGPWKQLEDRERALAARLDGPVYVLAGTLFERPMPKLPGADELHAIPSGFWKVVYARRGDGWCRDAFLFDQVDAGAAHRAPLRATVAEIGARAGLALPAALVGRDGERATSCLAELGPDGPPGAAP
jgi:endonuclease G